MNPLGALRDQQNVDGGLSDVDFDAVWTARMQLNERGWTAEIAILWTPLRYSDGSRRWNVNLQRVSWRKNESSGWSPWPRVMLPYRMDCAVLGDTSRLNGIGGPTSDRRAAIDGDVKWAVTSNGVLDVTVNPDFGQSRKASSPFGRSRCSSTTAAHSSTSPSRTGRACARCSRRSPGWRLTTRFLCRRRPVTGQPFAATRSSLSDISVRESSVAAVFRW